MYGKIFESIFDSTIISHGGDVVYIFISMIILSDKDGILPISIPAFSNRIAKSEEDIRTAIAILESPDPDSNSKEYDGRRIIPLSEVTNGVENRGWFVVNKDKYREKASRLDKTEKTANRVRRFRDKKCNAHVTPCNAHVTHEHVHTDIDTDIDNNCIGAGAPQHKKKISQISDEEFLKALKENKAYDGIQIEDELGKMDAWLSTRPGRKKTRRFVVQWLNRVEKPINANIANLSQTSGNCVKCGKVSTMQLQKKWYCSDVCYYSES